MTPAHGREPASGVWVLRQCASRRLQPVSSGQTPDSGMHLGAGQRPDCAGKYAHRGWGGAASEGKSRGKLRDTRLLTSAALAGWGDGVGGVGGWQALFSRDQGFRLPFGAMRSASFPMNLLLQRVIGVGFSHHSEKRKDRSGETGRSPGFRPALPPVLPWQRLPWAHPQGPAALAVRSCTPSPVCPAACLTLQRSGEALLCANEAGPWGPGGQLAHSWPEKCPT